MWPNCTICMSRRLSAHCYTCRAQPTAVCDAATTGTHLHADAAAVSAPAPPPQEDAPPRVTLFGADQQCARSIPDSVEAQRCSATCGKKRQANTGERKDAAAQCALVPSRPHASAGVPRGSAIAAAAEHMSATVSPGSEQVAAVADKTARAAARVGRNGDCKVERNSAAHEASLCKCVPSFPKLLSSCGSPAPQPLWAELRACRVAMDVACCAPPCMWLAALACNAATAHMPVSRMLLTTSAHAQAQRACRCTHATAAAAARRRCCSRSAGHCHPSLARHRRSVCALRPRQPPGTATRRRSCDGRVRSCFSTTVGHVTGAHKRRANARHACARCTHPLCTASNFAASWRPGAHPAALTGPRRRRACGPRSAQPERRPRTGHRHTVHSR